MFEDLQILLKAEYRPLWLDYCTYLRTGCQHFNIEITSPCRAEKIRLFEKAIYREFKLKNSLLTRLQQQFSTENLSLQLLSEPLQTWQYPLSNNSPTSE